MFFAVSLGESVGSTGLKFLVKSVLSRCRSTASNNDVPDDNMERLERLEITRKIRLLGLQSSQPRQALSVFDDYVHRQKKKPDIRMFAVAINCATVAKDLAQGREIHRMINDDFPQLKDDLMLKQQLRYFYAKCNDPRSAERLFQSSKDDGTPKGKVPSIGSPPSDRNKDSNT